MFVIESWPGSSLVPAPRVRASADPSILMDAIHPDLDIVVWGRMVPDDWLDASVAFTGRPAPIRIDGTLDDVLRTLKHPATRCGWPSFLVKDAEQSASMAAALGGSMRQRFSLRVVQQGEVLQPVPASKLQIVCCYGAGAVEWISGQSPTGPLVSSLSPFSIALMKPAPPAMAIHCRTWVPDTTPAACIEMVIQIPAMFEAARS
ncbi:hypothetical protein [Nguyenibacter sp. L1]|uniref:hypothetical protein n=1 Tax=Nguyenibacter sp. L1 TaxID=3049350 RepID=UPI002B494FB1|nr:hypothetical protein [Nguyenibacter sp. L1]WRH89107.1 hypothetical protein QN315_05635 [Nguyenibacter sp. L1]